jgi:heat-inducible transcriptional repressor
MSSTELKPRQKALLSAVIERYVATAEPVGSSVLAGDPRLVAQFGALSSATVRNELAELEERGLLAHPHTSAGRVPTDAGYRVYVNELLRPRPILVDEQRQMDAMAPPISSVEELFREATQILARLTGYPALASLPRAQKDTLHALQLNPLPPQRLILVLVTAASRIEHRVLEVGEEVSPTHLATVVNFLNGELAGKQLLQVRNADFSVVSRGLHDATVLDLAGRAWELVRQSVADLADEKIVVQGLVTLLDEPEFTEIGSARAALRVLGDEDALSGLLRWAQAMPWEPNNAQTVKIGSELAVISAPVSHGFSFVGVSYGSGKEAYGALGVLGPARMRYADAISLVPALAARLQVALEFYE